MWRRRPSVRRVRRIAGLTAVRIGVVLFFALPTWPMAAEAVAQEQAPSPGVTRDRPVPEQRRPVISETPRRVRASDPVTLGLQEAQSLLRGGRVEDGLRKLRELAAAHPQEWRVIEALGRTLESMDQREEAASVFRRAADTWADPSLPLVELQRLHRGLGALKAALEVCLEYLVRVDRADAWVADEVESLVRTDGVGPEAIRALEEAMRKRPDDPRLREILIIARLHQGEALRAVDEAGDLDRERKAQGRLLLRFARTAHDKGLTEAALLAYERLLAREIPVTLQDQVLLLRAQALRGLGRPAEALAAYDEAIRREGIGLAAQVERAELLAGPLNRPEDAIGGYRDALTALNRAGDAENRGADRIRLAMADLEIRLGRPSEAALVYQELARTAVNPSDRAEALYRAGEMLFFQGKLKEAQDTWYALTDSFPGQRWVNDALEGVLRIGENTDESGVPLAALAQAEYQRRLGRLERGLQIVDEALAAHPASRAADDLWLERSSLLLTLDRVAEARAAADTLGARFPDSRMAPRALRAVAERLSLDPATESEGQALYLELLTRYPESLEAPFARAALQRLKPRESSERIAPDRRNHP